MNITVNVNIPEKLMKETPESSLLAASGPLTKPNDSEPDLLQFQGPPMAMLLFALTRATSDPAHSQLMTAAERAKIKSNNALYRFNNPQGIPMNGVDVFDGFIAANPEVLVTLQAAQGMYKLFKHYCSKVATVWDDTCELKYSQLADMAQIDWRTLHP